MAVEYEISSDVATIKDVAPNTQVARVVSLYSGQITYDDEAGSKFATATIDGKSQRVMLCIAVNGTVTYDDVPSLYSTVDGHRCLNIVAPTETGTPDDVPSVYETVVIDGMNVRAVRCILINETPIYDGVSSTCTFVANGKTHTAQLVNQVSSSSIETIVKGVAPLSLPDAIANSLRYVKAFGGTEQDGTPTPDAPIDIVSNNGTIKVRRQSGLPLDYQKITFVRPDESIDLGIKTTNNTQITTIFYREASIAQYLYFSDSNSSGTTNTTAYLSSGGNWRFGGKTASINTNTITPYESIQNKDGVWLNGEKKATYTGVDSFTSTNNLKTGLAPSSATEGNIRYYSMLVEESGVTVLNLIPVRRLSDDKVGFYNLVNGDFFEATGNVVRGSDVSDPIEIYTDGTVETIKDSLNNTATAEMLLKVGDYQDEQEILSGAVTRNVGVKVLDGTENWQNISGYFNLSKTDLGSNSTVMPLNSFNIICSHFETKDGAFADGIGIGGSYVNFKYDSITTVLADWKTWLADQYAAGTPVTVIYPLAQAVTEQVAPQVLNVQTGDNILEITQASLPNLELEAKYSKSV